MPSLTLRDLWRARNFSPNPNQEQAILHTDGPLYLPAGPGSGKTRVLLLQLISKGRLSFAIDLAILGTSCNSS